MKFQRGVALSGLLLWSFVIILVAVLGMKIVPSAIQYYKTKKDIKAVAAQVAPDATVADIRNSYAKFADIDVLELKPNELDISKENGRVVISFAYEKRIPLFANLSLVIDYEGSTAE